jgi:DNA mismatch repair protein MSH5
VELAGGQCQVRPHREFVAQKGRNKLQQLRLLSQLPQSEFDDAYSRVSPSAPRNVNDFIGSRRNSERDPTVQRLYAAIRLLNFGGEDAPLCVSWPCVV